VRATKVRANGGQFKPPGGRNFGSAKTVRNDKTRLTIGANPEN